MEIVTKIAPICLAIIMFSLGLGLTKNILNNLYFFQVTLWLIKIAINIQIINVSLDEKP